MSDRRHSRSRSRSPRGHRGERSGGRRDGVGILVRNLPHDVRPDEVRRLFEKYGEVRDVYLPRDYYSGRPKGFGFVEFLEEDDAQEAIYQLDRSSLGGREITVCRAREGRKRPEEMRSRTDRPRYDRRRPRSPRRGYGRRRSRSRSRSRSRTRSRSRSRSHARSPPRAQSESPPREGEKRELDRPPHAEDDRLESPPEDVQEK